MIFIGDKMKKQIIVGMVLILMLNLYGCIQENPKEKLITLSVGEKCRVENIEITFTNYKKIEGNTHQYKIYYNIKNMDVRSTPTIFLDVVELESKEGFFYNIKEFSSSTVGSILPNQSKSGEVHLWDFSAHIPSDIEFIKIYFGFYFIYEETKIIILDLTKNIGNI